MLLLLGAVYYREQRFVEQGCVVVAGQVSSISILAQCFTSASLEQYLIGNSGTLSGIRNSSGYVSISCAWTPSEFSISSMSIVHINHHQHQRRSSFAVKQTNSQQQQLFKMSNKVLVVTRMRTLFFFSSSRKEFNFIPHLFLRDPPQFKIECR